MVGLFKITTTYIHDFDQSINDDNKGRNREGEREREREEKRNMFKCCF